MVNPNTVNRSTTAPSSQRGRGDHGGANLTGLSWLIKILSKWTATCVDVAMVRSPAPTGHVKWTMMMTVMMTRKKLVRPVGNSHVRQYVVLTVVPITLPAMPLIVWATHQLTFVQDPVQVM